MNPLLACLVVYTTTELNILCFFYLMNENVSSLAHGVWNFMRLPAKLAEKILTYVDVNTKFIAKFARKSRKNLLFNIRRFANHSSTWLVIW